MDCVSPPWSPCPLLCSPFPWWAFALLAGQRIFSFPISSEFGKLRFSLDLSISAYYGVWYICHKSVCLAFLPLLQPEKI